MFEQTFKNIDDILHKDAGCGSELDYVEQTSWILFLKYLDDLEKDRATAAELTGKTYTPIIDIEYQWTVWAAPKGTDRKIDHHNALTGDDLLEFVNGKLFPYLKKFKLSAESADTIEYKIGEIFSELKNRIQSGYNLREVINLIDELRFRTHVEKHEMSHLYEGKIQNMGNAGRNGGEYYTARPLIRTIVKVVNPQIGNSVYDGAGGSMGFLCEAFDYMKHLKGKVENLTTKDIETLQKHTFYGKEKKGLAYIIGIMNMIFHGIEAPNIIHTNTLAENLADIQEKDRYDVVLANPPFGGKERAEVQQNFPIKTGETASLFLQHFIKILKAGGKAGVVIKNTFLGNTDNATVSLRKSLLESCDLHTVLLLPTGAFSGASIQTVVLFFEKGSSTKKIWYYQLNLSRSLGKSNALNENDLEDFLNLQKDKVDSENSWSVKFADIDKSTFDLSPVNPNKKDLEYRKTEDILKELENDSLDILHSINELNNSISNQSKGWESKNLRDVAEYFNGLTYSPKNVSSEGIIVLRSSNIQNDELDFSDIVRVNANVKEKLIVREGDILMCSRNGSKRLVGKTATITELNEQMTFGTFMMIIRSQYNPYLAWYFKTNKFRKQISGGENTMINQITRYMLDDVTLPFPPLADFNDVVQKLDFLFAETKKLETVYEKKMNLLTEFKSSALHKAISFEIKTEKASAI
jgi:type I restriction enzyme M protein